jgi:hypothetical protein
MRLSWISWSAVAAFVALWAGMPQSAIAADAEGQFAIKGLGAQTCQRHVEARQTRSAEYGNFRSWLQGYVTAANRYEIDTYDAAPWGSAEVWAAIIDNHCASNPDEPFATVVQKLIRSLMPEKLEARSPVLTVSADGLSVRVYEEVVRRIQQQLIEIGLYSDAADGQFGASTQEALATYQLSEGLDATGLPDPLTVWKLVQP